MYVIVFFFKQKTAYEMRISDWSSDVCSSDLAPEVDQVLVALGPVAEEAEFFLDGLLGIGGGGFEGEGGVVQGVKPRRWGGLGSAHCRRRALRERPFDRLRAGFSRELWLPPLRRQGVRKAACEPLARGLTNAIELCSMDGRVGAGGLQDQPEPRT